ncbi:MAG: sigma-70 family RNA polymerase sigma factor, partial [Chloroflexota bacterium]
MRDAAVDPDSFAPLYEVYFPRIYAYCARRTGSAQEAEDLTSAIFIKALRGLHTYRGGNVGAWLFRIAHNEVVDHWRKLGAPQVPLDDMDFAAELAPPDASITRAEELARLQQAVAQLSTEQQDLLAMKLDGELTSQEIGAVVGKSASAVRVEIHRIIKLL